MKTKFRHTLIRYSLGLAIGLMMTTSQASEHVKVTALGSTDGEFCRFDRAMIFEDPNGTRILYDAGRTVAGADDPRLGKIDVILVSHMHGDHVGDKHIEAVNQGSCAQPETPQKAAPQTSTVNIALAKDAIILTGSEMPRFFASKLKAAGGNPKNAQLVRFGASKTIKGVEFTTVPAVHSNGINPAFITGELSKYLEIAGVTAYAGPPTGYVINFSNGLVVYLSGDTGMTAEQDLVVRGHYGAKLVVMNIGDTYTTGPKQAAHVINHMIRPNSVIPSHANEEATRDGKVLANTRTKSFIDAVRVPSYLPLSGRAMEFDSAGHCRGGCL